MLYTQIVVLLLIVCSILDIRMVSWINDMSVTTAELVVFSMVATFLGFTLIRLIELFHMTKARHDNRIAQDIKYSIRFQCNRLNRINQRHNLSYKKSRNSLMIHDTKLYMNAITHYYEIAR